MTNLNILIVEGNDPKNNEFFVKAAKASCSENLKNLVLKLEPSSKVKIINPTKDDDTKTALENIKTTKFFKPSSPKINIDIEKNKLRRIKIGKIGIEGTIDLHGLSLKEAALVISYPHIDAVSVLSPVLVSPRARGNGHNQRMI